MDNKNENIQIWARKCGYTGPMPKDMTSFLNESTVNIWNEIITKVKPRHEIEEMRRKVISHRLKSGLPINEAMPQEYEIYHKYKTLSTFKEEILARISEKEAVLKKSQRLIQKNGFELEKIKTFNEAFEVKTFLLEEKTKSFVANIETIQSKNNFLESTVFVNTKLNLTEHKNISDPLRQNSDKDKVKKLLRSHRNAVFSEIYASEKKLFEDLWNNVETCENINSSEIDDKIEYNDVKFDLYAKCLEHDIESKMLEKFIENLQSCLQNYKESYKQKLLSESNFSNKVELIMNKLDKQAKLAGLDAVNNDLKERLDYLRNELTLRTQSSQKLEDIKKELAEIKQSMSTAIKNISVKAEEASQKQTAIEIAKINSKSNLEMLLSVDLNYLSLMKDDIISKELMVFHEYPLQNYKKYSIDYKPHNLSNSPLSQQPCSNLLSELHVKPLQTPWELITSIYNDLRYITQLAAAAQISTNVLPSNITSLSVTPDFEYSTKVVQKLVIDLQSAKGQINLHELRLSRQRVQQQLVEWSEMKFGRFVAPEVVFDGKSYLQYEEEFMRYYNLL